MSRLWLAAGIAAIVFLTISLCAEKGDFKKRMSVAGLVALVVELAVWIFV